MSQLITYNSVTDGVTSRRYTGYPLNSTLVSSYTPDTIRSIINHAAAGQPYSTTVWIRINRVGIQISAQDPAIARTRIPVFIPIGLVHDIYMLPSINNVICIVYDELQSNMKGVLLYVVHPSDAQLLRDDFRIVKQASNAQQAPPPQQPYSSPFDNIYPPENNPVYTPVPSKSPLLYEPYRSNIRQPSPRRILYARENEVTRKPNITPTLLSITHSPYKGSYHSDREDHGRRRHKSPRKHKTAQSPSKRSSDSGIKQRKQRSRSPEKQTKPKVPPTNNSVDLTPEQLQQQQQQQQQLFLQQQQQQQQQQMAAWQANQQMPMIPMGIYNRYVPKTIPLPTGETLRTTLPPPGVVNASTNGAAMAYIEPQEPPKVNLSSRTPSRSRSNSPRRHADHQQNRSISAQHSTNTNSSRHHHHHHHRRNRANGNAYVITRGEPNAYETSSQQSRSRSKHAPLTNPNYNSSDNDDDTKQYLKMLIDEMQAMKLEMNRMRQLAVSAPKGRSDSIHADIKDLRSHIDTIRARIAMTPKVSDK